MVFSVLAQIAELARAQDFLRQFDFQLVIQRLDLVLEFLEPLPEVLGDAGPLVDPDQPSDIAAGIARVLSDAAYESACVLAGLERAAQFRWAQTAERVYDTYQQAMAWRAGRGAAV